MEVTIKKLIGLQKCDIRIGEIQTKTENGPANIKRLEDELKAMLNQLDEASNRLEDLERQKRQIEGEIAELGGTLENSNIKLSNIKSNKEYQAALKEISDLDKQKLRLEDKAIEIMEEIESLEEKCVAAKAERKRLKKKCSEGCNLIMKELKTLNQDLENLEKGRERLRLSIDGELLKKYNYLREHKGGLAISSVVNGVCQTCHMGIPPQKFNELIRGNELMSCPNCLRIMYWGEDERLQEVINE